MAYTYSYLEVAIGTKVYRMYRLSDSLFLRRLTKDTESLTLSPHKSEATKKDIVIPYADIRGIAAEGDVHYDEEGRRTELFFGELIIETKTKPQTLDVISDITVEDLLLFFEDAPFSIEKRLEPEQEQAKDRAPQAKTNTGMEKFLKGYTIVLGVYMVFALLFGNDIICYLSGALLLFNLVLLVRFPQYFSIHPANKHEKRKERFVSAFLMYPLFPCVVLLWSKSMNTENILLPAVVIAVLLSVLQLFFYRKELVKQKSSALSVLLISLILAFGIVGMLSLPKAARRQVSAETATVVDMESRSGGKRRSASYILTVEMPDGTKTDYYVKGSSYKETATGDSVQVNVYESTFGVRFTVVTAPSNANE